MAVVFGEDLVVECLEVAAEQSHVGAERGEFGRQPGEQSRIDGGIHGSNARELRVWAHE
ncbi:hypothetical protein Ntsu_75860 [Nocardia sp. IFM 10818]